MREERKEERKKERKREANCFLGHLLPGLQTKAVNHIVHRLPVVERLVAIGNVPNENCVQLVCTSVRRHAKGEGEDV